MIRGGHINIAILGAMEVAENGDLANWISRKNGQGHGRRHGSRRRVKKVVVVMEHSARATPRSEPLYLPITGPRVST